VEEDDRVTTTGLAKMFKVSPAAVTETLQILAKKKLVKYIRYYGVRLTEKGMIEAQKLLRKHRILEFLFTDFLSYDLKKACEEASRIDFYCSEVLINSICRTYGHPDTCPCDKRIFKSLECLG